MKKIKIEFTEEERAATTFAIVQFFSPECNQNPPGSFCQENLFILGKEKIKPILAEVIKKIKIKFSAELLKKK